MPINKHFDVVFSGSITTESPFHSAPPSIKAPKGKAKPLPRICVGNTGAEVPYISGSGIRGRLRRAAYQLILERLMEKDGLETSPFTMDDFYLNVVGGFAAESDGRIKTLAQREANPITSLFGTSYGWTAGRLTVGFAYPEIELGETFPTSEISGVRKDDLTRGDGSDYHVSDEVMKDVFTRQDQARTDTASVKLIEDLKKRIRKSTNEEEVASLQAELQDIEQNKSGRRTVASQLPLEGYEVIPAGCDLRHRFQLIGVTAAEIGFFLDILRHFSHRPIIGANYRADMGLISAKYDVAVFSNQPHNKVLSSSISFGGEMREFELGEGFEPYLSAWNEKLESLSVDDLKMPTKAKVSKALEEA